MNLDFSEFQRKLNSKLKFDFLQKIIRDFYFMFIYFLIFLLLAPSVNGGTNA
jgi:hypothetical protein